MRVSSVLFRNQNKMHVSIHHAFKFVFVYILLVSLLVYSKQVQEAILFVNDWDLNETKILHKTI